MELSDDEYDRVLNNGDSDNERGDLADGVEEEPATEKNNGEDEDEETKRRIDPSTSRKRIVRNPVPKLDAERLQGPKGILALEKSFEGFKFHGKGHERSDLNTVMKRLEYWAHRLFPKYCFDDFIEKMETLGTKKNIQVLVKKYRLGMMETVESRDTENGEEVDRGEREEDVEIRPIDEFDQLIAEQIEKQREPVIETRAMPTPSQGNILGSAGSMKPFELSDEIKARIEANRKLAFERKMARMKRLEEEKEKEKLEEARKSSQMARIQAQIRQQVPPLDIANIPEFLNEMPSTTESLAESLPTNSEISADTENPRNQDMEKPKRLKFEDSSGCSDPRSRTFMATERIKPYELKLITFDQSDGAACVPLHSEACSMEKPSKEIQDKSDDSLPELVDITEVSVVTETPESPDKARDNDPIREKQNMRKIGKEPEKLLTEEELLRGIDNAMEEIIQNRSIVL